MITVFGRNDEMTDGVVIADSLHRAYPARFIGSDLSRPLAQKLLCPRRHPSLLPISAQGFANASALFSAANRQTNTAQPCSRPTAKKC